MSDIALPIRASGPPLAERLLSDERLAKLAGRGDARAFTTIYERHHQAIYRYCRSIVRDDHDAQDALQSAMTRAYTALCASERDLAVRPWLFRIAHNEAVSVLRRRRSEDELVDVHESLDSVELRAEERERLSILLADLQALPERQRAALLMRELNGLSIEEIAVALSVSTGAAKQTLFEARSSLHEFAKGRAMECEAVRRAISDHDGRVLRGRGLRAHLRDCAGCRDFHAVIERRGADLRALAPPLPATLASATLTRLLTNGGGGGHAAAVSTAAGSALGGHVGASLLAKGLVGVAVIAAATAGTVHLTADHAGSTRRSPDAISASRRSHARSNGKETFSSTSATNQAVHFPSSTSSTSTGRRPSAPSGSIGPRAAPGQTAPGTTSSGTGRAPGHSHGAKTVGSHGTGSGSPRTTAGRRQRQAHGGSSPKRSAPARRHATKPVHPSGSPQGAHGGKPAEPSAANGSKGAGQGAHASQPHEASHEARAGGASNGAGRAGEAHEQTLTPAPPSTKQVKR